MVSLKGAMLASTGNQDRRPHGSADGPRRKKKRRGRKAKGPLYDALVSAATK